jgi:hypothetical protein
VDVIRYTYDFKGLLNHLVTAISKGISVRLGSSVSLPQNGQETQQCAGGPIPAQAGRTTSYNNQATTENPSVPANAHVEVSGGEVHGKAFLASVVCQMRGVDEHTQHHKSNADGGLPLDRTGNNMTSSRRQLDRCVK